MSSGVLRHVGLVRTDVLKEIHRFSSILDFSTLKMEVSSEMSVFTRPTVCHITEDAILV
jgi:hypothetical protein